MLGIISCVETAVLKDKNCSLTGSLGSVSQLKPEQELPHGETPGLGGILEYETAKGTPARDTFPGSCRPCCDCTFSCSPSLCQHRACGTELQVAHPKQGMNCFPVGFSAAEILSTLSKSLMCNGDKWPECQGNGVETAKRKWTWTLYKPIL